MNNNEIELVTNCRECYSSSLHIAQDFGGPSVYFHTQAVLQQRHDFLSERHIEMIYATLASWGMHRMGDPNDVKTKLVDFHKFKRSILEQKEILLKYRSLRMDQFADTVYARYVESLIDVYFKLVVSVSEATLVAHSKTLAHHLPDLIPPIDRQYTVRFFTQDNKTFRDESGKYRPVNLPVDPAKQFGRFLDYCVRIKRILDQCDKGTFEINPDTFNTSYLKIIDNMIMAFVKSASTSQ